MLFPTISSSVNPQRTMTGGGHGTSNVIRPGSLLVNRVESAIPQSIDVTESEFKARIITVMEAIVYLSDIGEQTTPENIARMGHLLHREAILDLADVEQTLKYGLSKSIFTWGSKMANTWIIDSKNIGITTQNNTYLQFFNSLANDSKGRIDRIKMHFDATKRKRNPILSYSQVYQDTNIQEKMQEANLTFSNLGLKPNVFDPTTIPSSYSSYHKHACLAPTSIHYAAREITKRLLSQLKEYETNIEDEQTKEKLTNLDLLEKGQKLLDMGVAKTKQPSSDSGPKWLHSSFAIENTIPSGERPGCLSSFAIVPPKK